MDGWEVPGGSSRYQAKSVAWQGASEDRAWAPVESLPDPTRAPLDSRLQLRSVERPDDQSISRLIDSAVKAELLLKIKSNRIYLRTGIRSVDMRKTRVLQLITDRGHANELALI